MKNILFIILLLSTTAKASECENAVSAFKSELKEIDLDYKKRNSSYSLWRVLDEVQYDENTIEVCKSIDWTHDFIWEYRHNARKCIKSIKKIRKICPDSPFLDEQEGRCELFQKDAQDKLDKLLWETDQFYETMNCTYINNPPDIDWG